ncbi:MAG: MotA/TolQ/ExbB proton channel family protein, partial [Verrucomicrobiota bacterium]|nr:MotA/TolQ/ExbB proton channel family protein [Verrucomicrobiota bacterium]
LEKRLNMLGTIAQIAPLLGLLGTVLGFIKIFQGVWLKGNWVLANDLAGGIWQGLVCMALGLAIAIPCTIAFNYLVGRKDDIALDIEKSNAELLNILAFELASLNINLGPKVNQVVDNDIGQRSGDQ